MYKSRQKWPEPTRCPDCGAVYVNGRWTWSRAPDEASLTLCPACQRINDRYPAGRLELGGPFFAEHRDEILNLIRNIEAVENLEHPMERVMSMREENAHTVIRTTGVHVARRMGEAVARAYQGELSYQYGDGDASIDVHWQR